MQFESVNPATGDTMRTFEGMSSETVKQTIDESNRAFQSWRKTEFDHRSGLMRKVAELLRRNKDRYARLMTEEMGKPIGQSEAEIEKCATVCTYYADHAEEFLSDQPIETGEGKTFVSFRPMGVIFAIMPWNFPFWQVLRFAVPAIMAGNAALLKHSPNVPGSALEIEQLFREAGFPDGLFRSLLIDVPETETIISDPRVRLVTLTGSVRAGRSVAETAGRWLKKTVLELGGSDPYVVLEDADLNAAVSTCVTSRLINSGQSCIAAKRFIVVDQVAEEFERLLIDQMKSKSVGDPLDRGTDVGPMAREDLRDQLHSQVERSVQAGARLLLGGTLPDQAGFYYPPTVLSGVKKGMAAYDEELFGPVASIIRVSDEAEAIETANDSDYGLGGAVFTSNRSRGEEIASKQIDSGNVFVNAFVKSDPRVPFGGVKNSGYGRELSSFGIREYVNIKTVWVN